MNIFSPFRFSLWRHKYKRSISSDNFLHSVRTSSKVFVKVFDLRMLFNIYLLRTIRFSSEKYLFKTDTFSLMGYAFQCILCSPSSQEYWPRIIYATDTKKNTKGICDWLFLSAYTKIYSTNKVITTWTTSI